MREMSATGNLTRKISLRRAASWEDEDAKLLATTFDTSRIPSRASSAKPHSASGFRRSAGCRPSLRTKSGTR